MPQPNRYTVTVEPCWGVLVLGHDPSCHTVTTLTGEAPDRRILTVEHRCCESHAQHSAIELRERYQRMADLAPDQPCPMCARLGYECPGPRYCGCVECEDAHALEQAARFQSARTDR